MSVSKYIVDFYNFFIGNIIDIRYLADDHPRLEEFFIDNIGEIKLLQTDEILLMLKRLKSKDLALIFHEIYKKPECNIKDPVSLIETYREEIFTITAARLLFTNWELKDLIYLNEKSSDFSDEFDEIILDNQFKGKDSNFYNYQFLELFLKCNEDLKGILMEYTIELNSELVNNMMEENLNELK